MSAGSGAGKYGSVGAKKQCVVGNVKKKEKIWSSRPWKSEKLTPLLSHQIHSIISTKEKKKKR